MTHQIYVTERKADGSEQGRGLCEFISVPCPGDEIFITRNTSIDRLRIVAVKHHSIGMLTANTALLERIPKVDLLAELIESRSIEI